MEVPGERELVEAALTGDEAAFGRFVAPYRRELHAHCYRMLGSVQDAEDAVQTALLGAWQGLPGFGWRSSPRTWLHRIAANACLRMIEKRPRRVLSAEHAPARTSVRELGEPVTEPIWLEPYPEDLLDAGAADPQVRYELRESVELAFVAALQHLPPTQRAVLILREVLAFPATEVAAQLDTTVASVTSALQRARAAVEQRVGRRSQQATLRDLGDRAQRELTESFVAAWERSDVPALLDLLVEDVRFGMPPLPAWFDGRADVGRFLAERIFEAPWRLLPVAASGQPAFACYLRAPDGVFRLTGITVLTVRGDRIAELTSFLDTAVHPAFGLPAEHPG